MAKIMDPLFLLLSAVCLTCVRSMPHREYNVLCSHNGQFVVNPKNECTYFRCDYASHDTSSNSRFVAIEMKCPYGTASSLRRFGPFRPCIEKSDSCGDQATHYEYIPSAESQGYPMQSISKKSHDIEEESAETHDESEDSPDYYAPQEVAHPVTYAPTLKTTPEGHAATQQHWKNLRQSQYARPSPRGQDYRTTSHPESDYQPANPTPNYHHVQPAPDTYQQRESHPGSYVRPSKHNYQHPVQEPDHSNLGYRRPGAISDGYHYTREPHGNRRFAMEGRQAVQVSPEGYRSPQNGYSPGRQQEPTYALSYNQAPAAPYFASQKAAPAQENSHHSYREHSSFTMEKSPQGTKYHMTRYKSPDGSPNGGKLHEVEILTDGAAMSRQFGPILDDSVNLRLRRKLAEPDKRFNTGDFVHPVDFDTSFNKLAKILNF